MPAHLLITRPPPPLIPISIHAYAPPLPPSPGHLLRIPASGLAKPDSLHQGVLLPLIPDALALIRTTPLPSWALVLTSDVSTGRPGTGLATGLLQCGLPLLVSQELAVTGPSEPLTILSGTLKEIHDYIPANLFERKTGLAFSYFARDIALAGTFFYLATHIDTMLKAYLVDASATPLTLTAANWATWLTYWWFQGLILTGIWVIGHECGHGVFSASQNISDIVGFIAHTFLLKLVIATGRISTAQYCLRHFLLTPYFSWRFVHHCHYSHHASIKNDKVYMPCTRSDLKLPEQSEGLELEELFSDTPLYTLTMLIIQEFITFPAYLCVFMTVVRDQLADLHALIAVFNVSGQKRYLKYSNHFNHALFSPCDYHSPELTVGRAANAIMFNKGQGTYVLLSTLGLVVMGVFLYDLSVRFGAMNIVKFYWIPWLLVTHWFIMITYLQHTDPILPHYRKGQWNFQRGAVATVDRNFLSWQGRFFLHDVAHYHVIHHFFPMMPWYSGAEVTKYLKEILGLHYHRSNDYIFKALWYNYNFCQFIEDKGDIAFYRNRQGKLAFDIPKLKANVLSS
ncbi:unnamed protein product [Mycena citricolor]|uniref:Fatty acid desaturase domain-containing protein n=1 Tax=Mycena citricolor TaxID=2018698 RepID=A0AAD2H9Y4_9AGAR|nr:unnamed protein product [Mycena citricolor]